MSILKANISRLGLPYTPTVLHPRDLQLIPSLVDNSQNAWIIVSGKQNTDKMGHAMGIEKTSRNSIYLWDTAFSQGELSRVDSQEVLKRTLRYFSNRYAYFIRF